MKILIVLLPILVIFYGGLTILTCIIQFKKREINLWSNIMMLLGGTLTITAIIFSYIKSYDVTFYLILGLVFIHISAIDNGITMNKKLNPKHHLVRLSISILILLLYFIVFS